MTTSAVEWTFHSHSPEQSQALGRRLGEAIDAPLVIALIGPLGAGKTALVRAIADGLGIRDTRLVSSPTFVLLQQYTARLPIYHFDAYRLETPDQFEQLGPEEYFEQGVCVVEWADRCGDGLPRERLEIQIAISGATDRSLTLRGFGEQACVLLKRL